MRRVTYMLLFALFFVSNASSQEPKQQKAKLAVVVPAEAMLVVIASQPDCPLKFEKASIVKYVEGLYGDAEWLYQLRNCGVKPIRAYTIATFASSGGGNVVSNELARTGELLMPGKTPRNSEGNEIEIVPLTEELRTKLNLHRPMKAVTVFMVVRVDFSDGTTYSDETVFKALQEYFGYVGARVVVH